MIHITITLDISTHSALRLAEGSKWISLNLNKRGTQFREEKYHRVVYVNTEEGNYFSVVNVKDNSLKTFAPSQIGNKKEDIARVCFRATSVQLPLMTFVSEEPLSKWMVIWSTKLLTKIKSSCQACGWTADCCVCIILSRRLCYFIYVARRLETTFDIQKNIIDAVMQSDFYFELEFTAQKLKTPSQNKIKVSRK